MAKKSDSKTESKPVYRTVEILPLCGCTWKPNPHSHNGKPEDEWNWDKTHAIWEEQEKNRKPPHRIAYAKYKWQHLVTG